MPTDHPVLFFSDWCECIFNGGGEFLTAGKTLDDADQFGAELYQFWERFAVSEPEFPFTREVDRREWSRTIPVALHGDEGRGRSKCPVMVMAVQTIMPIVPSKTNLAGLLGSV